MTNENPISRKILWWLFATVCGAIVATLIAEFWGLVKSGTLFDWLETVSGEVQEANFIRTDLVGSAKQSVAQWILSISCVIATILALLTKQSDEQWLDPFICGIGYGFALGLGLLFLLSNFDRFKDIHLAVGEAQYGIAGIVMISTICIAFVIRFKNRF